MLKALKKGKASSKPPGLQGAALRELIAPRLRLWLCAQVALKFELITRLELQHRLDSLGLSEDTEMKSGTTVATAIAQVQEWLDAELGFLTTASASGLISDKPLFAVCTNNQCWKARLEELTKETKGLVGYLYQENMHSWRREGFEWNDGPRVARRGRDTERERERGEDLSSLGKERSMGRKRERERGELLPNREEFMILSYIQASVLIR